MKNWIATFFRIVRDDKGQTQGYPIPWAIERPSLYAFLAAYADTPEGLPDSELPCPTRRRPVKAANCAGHPVPSTACSATMPRPMTWTPPTR